jgi:tetratricopeptide (TPR) repeat protein
MKSQRRHELEQNTFDAELARVVGFFRKHGTTLVTVVLVLAVAGLVVVWLNRRAEAQQTEIQNRYDHLRVLAATPEADEQEVIRGFMDLAAQDTVPLIAADAMLQLGRIHATRALVAVDEQSRVQAIQQAQSYYERASQQFADSIPAAAGEALYGLGKLAETQGLFEQAGLYYEQILATPALEGYPVLALARQANTALDTYSQPITLPTTQPAWAETKPSTQPATNPTDEQEPTD